jgi:hypothetical protein
MAKETPTPLGMKIEMIIAAIVVGIGPVLWAYGALRSLVLWLWG